jgi:GMP synthase (glutamine-hydrolysing)
MEKELVLIVDFGGQYNQLIARRVRDCNVYCEIIPYTYSLEKIKEKNPKGIIFTGGPSSVYAEGAPKISKEIFDMNIPILGICYGAQIMSYALGGNVRRGDKREYGKTEINYKDSLIFKGVDSKNITWMSHTDLIDKIPEDFEIIAHTNDCPVAAIQNEEKKLYGV